MSSFDSLTLACEGWFDKPLCDLPDAVRQRIEEDFLPMPWDRLTAAGRRDVTQQIDERTDPALEHVRQVSWDLSERMIAITTDIATWEAVPIPNALSLAEKERRLKELRQELAGIEAEIFVDGGQIEVPGNPAQQLKRKSDSAHPSAPVNTTPAEKPRGSTVRREARRLDTEALHRQWQKAYETAKKARPNMTVSWHSKQISKMPIAKNRSAETIRRNLK